MLCPQTHVDGVSRNPVRKTRLKVVALLDMWFGPFYDQLAIMGYLNTSLEKLHGSNSRAQFLCHMVL